MKIDKNKIYILISCVFFILSIIGCLSKAYKAYDGPDLSPAEVATIKAYRALNYIGVCEVDGKKVKPSRSCQVLPGKHELELKFGDSASMVEGTRHITVDVKAGHVYQLSYTRLSKITPSLYLNLHKNKLKIDIHFEDITEGNSK